MLYDKSEITIVIIIFVFPSLTHILVKLLYEHGVEIFYIPSNRFCIIPQILNDFHLEFKPLDLRTWFSEQMYLSSMKQMSFKDTLF